jgi:hypothetical protein
VPYRPARPPELQHSDRTVPATTTCGASSSMNTSARPAAGHFDQHAAHELLNARATPPIATPRHHQPGEHSYAPVPNVQHSAAAEGRRLQCIVRLQPQRPGLGTLGRLHYLSGPMSNSGFKVSVEAAFNTTRPGLVCRVLATAKFHSEGTSAFPALSSHGYSTLSGRLCSSST